MLSEVQISGTLDTQKQLKSRCVDFSINFNIVVMALCVDLSNIFRIVWHFIAFAQYAISIYYDLNYVKAPPHLEEIIVRPGMGGRSRFLTYWCMVSKSNHKIPIDKQVIRNVWLTLTLHKMQQAQFCSPVKQQSHVQRLTAHSRIVRAKFKLIPIRVDCASHTNRSQQFNFIFKFVIHPTAGLCYRLSRIFVFLQSVDLS